MRNRLRFQAALRPPCCCHPLAFPRRGSPSRSTFDSRRTPSSPSPAAHHHRHDISQRQASEASQWFPPRQVRIRAPTSTPRAPSNPPPYPNPLRDTLHAFLITLRSSQPFPRPSAWSPQTGVREAQGRRPRRASNPQEVKALRHPRRDGQARREAHTQGARGGEVGRRTKRHQHTAYH